MDKLNIYKLGKQNSKNIKIGELTPEVISSLNLNLNPQNIYIWSNRIEEHCQKHKDEYSSPTAFYNAVESIPSIIQNPDYIGTHANGNIQYIKKLDDISLVGIKIIKSDNSLLFRTIYPITEDKLNYYIKTNRVHKI